MVKPRSREIAGQVVMHPLLRRAGLRSGVLIAMTDEIRTPDPVALAKSLPRHSIIVLRHYHHPRRDLIAMTLRRVTRQRRQTLLIAGDARLARRVRADGLHLGRAALFSWKPAGLPVISAACHDARAIYRANELGVPLKLVSPAFETRSHPGAATLGGHRLGILTSWHHVGGYIALGGVGEKTAGKLRGLSGLAGLAAIDGLA